MGLRSILTRPINIGSTVMQWNEPMLYPLRLKGDLWLRALVVLGAWAGVTGVLLALFAFNADPPGILTAVGLGLIFGLGPALVLTMMRRNHVAGSVKIRKNDFYVQRQYASLSILWSGWIEYAEWPYNMIRECVIVPAQRIGKPFSVMLLTVGDGTLMFAVPRSIDLKKLADFLSRKGVAVTPGRSLPGAFRRPLNLFVGLSVPALALLFFLGGATFYLVRVGLPGDERGHRVAHREQFPDVADMTTPPPTLSSPPPGRSGKPATGHGAQGEASDTPSPRPDTPTLPTPRAIPGRGFGGRPARQSTDPPTPSDDSAPRSNLRDTGTLNPSSRRRTPSVGGSGGTPFETIDGQRRPVIGLRSRMGAWGGADRVASLEPLFAPAPAHEDDVQIAREGYALGALDVSGADFVDAVRPVFMKMTSDGLDADDIYDGEWIGTTAEGDVVRLTGEGAEVIGIYGRGAAVLDAVGLIVRDGN